MHCNVNKAILPKENCRSSFNIFQHDSLLNRLIYFLASLTFAIKLGVDSKFLSLDAVLNSAMGLVKYFITYELKPRALKKKEKRFYWGNKQLSVTGLQSYTCEGSLTSTANQYREDAAGDWAYGLSSLSEKTRTSNHLRMSLQRQHILLSFFKTLSVGPVWSSNP